MGCGSVDGWEDAAPSAALAAATEDAGPDSVGRLPIIYSAVKLQHQGYTGPEIAAILGLSYMRVYRALHDPRAAVVGKRLVVDKDAADAIQKAQADYRLARAWDVLGDELESNDRWIKHQAALAIIAASKADKTGPSRTELVVSPELAFDDQNPDDLQDDVPDDADSDDLTQFDAQYSDDA